MSFCAISLRFPYDTVRKITYRLKYIGILPISLRKGVDMKVVVVADRRHVEAYRRLLASNETQAQMMYRNISAIFGLEYASVVRWEAIREQRKAG